ncbi:hypothetical protein LX88_006179 [Lentzea californiensis]|nr:hypothetical protein [Lentzea californiensis]
MTRVGFSGDEDVVEDLAPDGADDAFAVAFIRRACGALLITRSSSASMSPPRTTYQPGQRGEPESVCRLVAERKDQLSEKDAADSNFPVTLYSRDTIT